MRQRRRPRQDLRPGSRTALRLRPPLLATVAATILLSAAGASAVLATATTAGAAPRPGTPTARAATTAALPSFPASCLSSTLKVRPRSVVVACGDGNIYLTSVKWDHWSSKRAHGAGNAHQNDCSPDCAQGHFRRYRITVSLARPATCASGAREFTRLVYRFVARKPKGVQRKSAVPFPCV